MKNLSNKALLVGGNGFLGYSVLKELSRHEIRVRSIDQAMPEKNYAINGVEYLSGDVYDRNVFIKALEDVDIVYYFISTTFPNTSDTNLQNEIEKSLKTLDYILDTMAKYNVRQFVYPSSGGAIYGDKNDQSAVETDVLAPKTAYGVGKQMSEDIIKFYYESHGISSYIFRIGNVYGSSRFRDKPQGVIDVFIQNAISGKQITVWGNAESAVRDYIYIEDVAKAIVCASKRKKDGVSVYNIGSGIGTSVKDIIEMIEEQLDRKLDVEYKSELSSGISRIVLSSEKIKQEIGWEPTMDIRNGIAKTIADKVLLIKNTR